MRVLIADDEDDVRDLLAEMIRRERLQREAEEARAALGDKEYRRRMRAEEDKHRRWSDKERRGF